MKVRSIGVVESKNFLVGGCSPVSRQASGEYELEVFSGGVAANVLHASLDVNSLTRLVSCATHRARTNRMSGVTFLRVVSLGTGGLQPGFSEATQELHCKLAIDAQAPTPS